MVRFVPQTLADGWNVSWRCETGDRRGGCSWFHEREEQAEAWSGEATERTRGVYGICGVKVPMTDQVRRASRMEAGARDAFLSPPVLCQML